MMMTSDDRDSVKSNLQALGASGALRYSAKQLTTNPPVHVRRMCILTIRAAAKLLRQEIDSATRLARCHTSGLRSIGVKVALLLVVAAPAAAQSVVYTNIVDGRAQHEIVRVVRVVTPAAAIPPSIETTLVLPRNYKPPLGARSYVPPSRVAAASSIPAPKPQPWFINGVYAGPSPSGNWMSTSIGRPIVDVRIISTPRSRH
jgi:hypothetical protein